MRKINAIKSFAKSHYYAFCLFAFFIIYVAIVPGECKPWVVNDVTYSFYAVDFSLGFCSRIIQGALHNLIFSNISYVTATIYLICIFVVTVAILCFLAEKLLLSIDPKYRKAAIIILLFFITGPATFAIFLKTFGIIDFFWVFSTALFLLALQKKQLYFLAIPIFVFMVFVYYAALICYVPLLAIILLYKLSTTTDKKEKRYLTIVFFIACALAIAFSVYFVAFERSNLNYTMEEFDNILISRGVDEGNLFYYNYSYYRYLDNFEANTGNELFNVADTDSPFAVPLVLMQQIIVTLKLISFSHVTLIVMLLILPILVFIYRILFGELKASKENKLKKFTLLCTLALFPFILFAGFCLSTDVVRWISNAFTCLLFAFVYILYKERDHLAEKVHNQLAGKTALLIPYFIVYSLTTYFPDLQ